MSRYENLTEDERRIINWRQTQYHRDHREPYREAARRWAKKALKSPEYRYKQMVQRITRAAVKSGLIHDPGVCQDCGVPREFARIEIHHWSYNPLHWFDVRFVCRACHMKRNRADGFIAGAKKGSKKSAHKNLEEARVVNA